MLKTNIFYDNLKVAVDLLFLDGSGLGLDSKKLSNLINTRYPELENCTEQDIDFVLKPDVTTLQEDFKHIYAYAYDVPIDYFYGPEE